MVKGKCILMALEATKEVQMGQNLTFEISINLEHRNKHGRN
jgi:hypothetical protein